MDYVGALTSASINIVQLEIYPRLICHETTVGYLQILLTPYEEAIRPAINIDQIKEWIPQAFPEELAKHALSDVSKAQAKNWDNDKQLEFVKEAVIEYLLAEILELGGRNTDNSHDIFILPWDIQLGIGHDDELSQIFNITPDDKNLPISIKIENNDEFIHMVNEYFLAGLSLFCAVSINDIKISMFGVPFTTDYITTQGNRFIRQNTSYTVEVGGIIFGFNNPDFMQGFITGALWTNVDHHVYWKNLIQHNHDGDVVLNF